MKSTPKSKEAIHVWLETCKPAESIKPTRPTAKSGNQVERDDFPLPSAYRNITSKRKSRRSIHGEQKKSIGVAHIDRVKNLLARLKNPKFTRESILRSIDREIDYLAEFQGIESQDLPYYSQTLTQLASKLFENKLFDHALHCVRRAREVAPADPYPLSLELSFHGSLKDITKAEEIFEHAKTTGMVDKFTSNAMVDAYGKAGNLDKATEVFEQAEAAGLVNEAGYNSLLDAYGKAGDLNRAEEIFAQAKAAGLLNEVGYNSLLDAYGKAGDLNRAEEIFMQVKAAGLLNEFGYSSLLDAYGKAGDLERAEEIFAQAKAAGLLDEVGYNSLIDAYGKAGDLKRAEEIFAQAKAAGLLDEFGYNSLLDAYGKAGDLKRAEEIFAEAKAVGLLDEFGYNSLIDAYGKAGDLKRAEEIFTQATAAGLLNEVGYNSLIDAYGKAGDLKRAEEIFAEAKAVGLLDEVGYNSLIDAYGKAGDLKRAEEIFAQAKAAGLLDEVGYNSLIDAYGKAGDLKRAEEIFTQAKAAGLLDEFGYNSLLDAYGKAGDLKRAEEIFAEAKAAGSISDVSYGALMDANVRQGNISNCISIFEQRIKHGVKLTDLTKTIMANILLKGLYAIDDLRRLFEILPDDFITSELLIYYARLHKSPSKAIEELKFFPVKGLSASYICKFRVAISSTPMEKNPIVISLANEVEEYRNSSATRTSFSDVMMSDTLSKCHQATGQWEKMYHVWDSVKTQTMDLSSRAAFLAGHGRDSIRWGLQNHKAAELNQALIRTGGMELLEALSLSQVYRLSTPASAATETDVVAGMSKVRVGLSSLRLKDRSEILNALQTRTSSSLWQQPFENVVPVPSYMLGDVRAGQAALLEMLEMHA